MKHCQSCIVYLASSLVMAAVLYFVILRDPLRIAAGIGFSSHDYDASSPNIVSITGCLGQHECDNGSCIRTSWLCDGVEDCADGSDERNCQSGCGGLAVIESEIHLATFNSSLHEYKDNSNCEWRIYAPDADKTIAITFVEFATERVFDPLRIYEGIGRNKTLQAKYSGFILPPPFHSRTSKVTLKFTSDGSRTYPGFKVMISWIDSDDDDPCQGQFLCNNQSCVDTSMVCDEIPDCLGEEDKMSCPSGCGKERDLTSDFGEFSTLHFPAYYPDNLKCIWRIRGKAGELVQIEFSFFNTERNFDVLKIFNGIGSNKHLPSSLSGSGVPAIFRSRHHEITLTFTSDFSANRPGFNATYQIGTRSTLKVCGRFGPEQTALGMENRSIQDFQIAASSSLSIPYWLPHNARLNNPNGAWMSRRDMSIFSSPHSWIQVDLLKPFLITSLLTQGQSYQYPYRRYGGFVTSYLLQYRLDNGKWKRYFKGMNVNENVLRGNVNSFSIKRNDFDPPFLARYIRIYPLRWRGIAPNLRLEIYGCNLTEITTSSQEGCKEDEFQCESGTCVAKESVCDGKADCPDRSDEISCSGCSWDQFECLSGECVTSSARCNDVIDCVDGSDEVECSTCNGNDFLCSDRNTCISRKLRCDGYKDCWDFSDELRCNHSWLCNDSSDYRCGDGECVSGVNLACNDVFDCTDQSDERECDCGQQTPVFFGSEKSIENGFTEENQFSRQPRIVGGSKAEAHSWPWQVSLVSTKSGKHFCGATIIDESWIVTAAHCLKRLKPSDVVSKVGLHFRRDYFKKAQTFDAESFHLHPRYDDETIDFDVALIRLKTPIIKSLTVNKICLPPPNHIFHPDQKCWVTGWGTLYKKGPQPDVLHEAEIPVIDSELCNSRELYDGKITPRMICAGNDAGTVDSCQGDSGGPLVCREPGKNRWFLAGIVSWGVGCGIKSKPGVYTKVTEVSNWIRKIVHEKSPE